MIGTQMRNLNGSNTGSLVNVHNVYALQVGKMCVVR